MSNDAFDPWAPIDLGDIDLDFLRSLAEGGASFGAAAAASIVVPPPTDSEALMGALATDPGDFYNGDFVAPPPIEWPPPPMPTQPVPPLPRLAPVVPLHRPSPGQGHGGALRQGTMDAFVAKGHGKANDNSLTTKKKEMEREREREKAGKPPAKRSLIITIPMAAPAYDFPPSMSLTLLTEEERSQLSMTLEELNELDSANRASLLRMATTHERLRVTLKLLHGVRPVPFLETARLYRYQERAMNWMAEMERRPVRHGIQGFFLCLDMGLGKTLVVFSFILWRPRGETPNLAIVSLSVMREWHKTAYTFFDKAEMDRRAVFLHISFMSAEQMVEAMTDENLRNVDLVVTTYENVMSSFRALPDRVKETFMRYRDVGEQGRRVLEEVTTRPLASAAVPGSKGVNRIHGLPKGWERVICDESQRIRNPDSATFQSVIGICSKKRILMTGTHTVNYVTDIWAQFRTIGYDGTPRKRDWNRRTAHRTYRAHRLAEYIYRLNYEEAGVELPPCKEERVLLKLLPRERQVYDVIHAKTKAIFMNAMKNLASYANVLVMLLRLRQSAVAAWLLNSKGAVDEMQADAEGAGEDSDLLDPDGDFSGGEDEDEEASGGFSSDEEDEASDSDSGRERARKKDKKKQKSKKDKKKKKSKKHRHHRHHGKKRSRSNSGGSGSDEDERAPKLPNVEPAFEPGAPLLAMTEGAIRSATWANRATGSADEASPVVKEEKDVVRGDVSSALERLRQQGSEGVSELFESSGELMEFCCRKLGEGGFGATKMRAALTIYKTFLAEHPGEKLLGFSMFTTVLGLFADVWDEAIQRSRNASASESGAEWWYIPESLWDAEVLIIDGSTTGATRSALLEEFSANERARILLLSGKAGGEGLTITAASGGVLFEPHWTRQPTKQQKRRFYRIGQMRTTYWWELVMEDTIEERILDLCDEKDEIANGFEAPIQAGASGKRPQQEIHNALSMENIGRMLDVKF